MTDIQGLLEIAIQAVVAGGKEIMAVYEHFDGQVEYKSDNSPLTIADKKADMAIRTTLDTTGIPILSEEGKNTTFLTYKLRAKAVTEKISQEDLSKVLLMINKKRGYKSSRKVQSEDEGTAVEGMEAAKYLYDNNLTPGQYVYEILIVLLV